MKISFVIPAYNEENFIGSCLESVIKEAGSCPYSVEIIVVNNGSTDRTRETAMSYPQVKVIDEPEKGIVRARQTGFLNSQGELIANIDADAILPKGWLEKVMKEFKKNENLICLSGPHIYYDLPKTARFLTKVFYGFGFLFYLLNKHILKVGSLVQGGNFIVRRSALEKIDGFDTKIYFHGEDTDIARRLHKLGDVKFTFSLPIYISGRRLAKEGVVVSAYRYAINYMWTIFLKRPFSNEISNDIRIKPAFKKTGNKLRWTAFLAIASMIFFFLSLFYYPISKSIASSPTFYKVKSQANEISAKVSQVSKEIKLKISSEFQSLR